MWKSEAEEVIVKRQQYHCSTCDYIDPYELSMITHELTHEVETKDIESRSNCYSIHNIKSKEQAVKIAKYYYNDDKSNIEKPGWYYYDRYNRPKFTPVGALIPEFKDDFEQVELSLKKIVELANENSRDS